MSEDEERKDPVRKFPQAGAPPSFYARGIVRPKAVDDNPQPTPTHDRPQSFAAADLGYWGSMDRLFPWQWTMLTFGHEPPSGWEPSATMLASAALTRRRALFACDDLHTQTTTWFLEQSDRKRSAGIEVPPDLRAAIEATNREYDTSTRTGVTPRKVTHVANDEEVHHRSVPAVSRIIRGLLRKSSIQELQRFLNAAEGGEFTLSANRFAELLQTHCGVVVNPKTAGKWLAEARLVNDAEDNGSSELKA